MPHRDCVDAPALILAVGLEGNKKNLFCLYMETQLDRNKTNLIPGCF